MANMQSALLRVLFQRLRYVVLNIGHAGYGRWVLIVDLEDAIDYYLVVYVLLLTGCTSLCWRNRALCQTPAGRMHGHGTGLRKGHY